MGCHALLQGIFLTQGSNLCFLWILNCRCRFFTAEPRESPSWGCPYSKTSFSSAAQVPMTCEGFAIGGNCFPFMYVQNPSAYGLFCVHVWNVSVPFGPYLSPSLYPSSSPVRHSPNPPPSLPSGKVLGAQGCS